MPETKIEWADRTWNPVGGCKNVSPGCVNCYARERSLPRVVRAQRGRTAKYEKLIVETLPGQANRWTGNTRIWRDTLEKPLRWKKNKGFVFVCSLSDLFSPNRKWADIRAVFAVMLSVDHATWLVLTKHPDRLASFWEDIGKMPASVRSEYLASETGLSRRAYDTVRAKRGSVPWPPKNVWLGVSVETQIIADLRIPPLLQIDAAKRFISYEPALGPLTLRPYGLKMGLDWVIAGCESGPRARPADLSWFRRIRDECIDGDISFFLKQAKEPTYQRLEHLPKLDGVVWAQRPVRKT